MRNTETVSSMLCPVCHTGLALSDRQGVEIDYCPQCRGVWLDRGELDKIIERSAGDLPPVPVAGRQSYRPDRVHSAHDARYGAKRKKSFLEELFD
ncbi:zf-TFIIB domain-containing protein [soil metagenome]